MAAQSDDDIRARAPLRLGFGGGGTDLSPFCDQHGGYVMNATVSLYAYAHLSPRRDGMVEFEAVEQGQKFTGDAVAAVALDDTALLHRGVYNRIVRDYNGGVPLPVSLRTTVDVPAGSGMGGSSALVVAMLEAFRTYLALPFGEYDLARLAFDIERHDLALAGGKQDQYAASFGGFNFMEFYDLERVIVNPLRIHTSVIRELEASIVLYYTGQSRSSAQIIKSQQAHLIELDEKSIEAMKSLKREAMEIKEALLTGRLSGLAESLNRGWAAKKATAAAVSTPEIDRVLDLAFANGAVAGKVSGAGGGGFIMLLCEPQARQKVLDVLANEAGIVLPCQFTDMGAVSWRSCF